MTEGICKWPGCKIPVAHIAVCGRHQLALKVVYHAILGLGFRKEIAKNWACRVGPFVATQNGNGPWIIKESVTSIVARRALRAVGLGERASYSRIAAMEHFKADEVTSESFITQTIRDGEWLKISEAAEMVGTTHRYLRHLVYETKIPAILVLATARTNSRDALGFFRTELPSLRAEVEMVYKRRSP